MATNISESLKGKKRPREADIDAPTGDFDQIPRLEENLTFSSTLVGLRMMRAQFPNNEKVTVQLFILRSQLYGIVDDRTQVDRDFRGLREKVLRVFKLNTGQDDHAIIFLDNYLCQMERVVKRFKEKDDDILEIQYNTIKIQLKNGLRRRKLLSRGGKVKDEDISLLINSGFLLSNYGIYFWIRQLIDQNVHWSAIPNIGSVLKGLSQVYNKRFHLSDLIGSGHLKTAKRLTGLVVRVSKD
ncbi:serine/threonine-protein kinase 19 [Pyrus ussuriensis x Pyrus communis]|uniref:Serine/threonine-protein kinase 19 n=1 Tax=Pyrus ussuriensis x Pyrus communis TaxID=2448454 RepID=A0A5N5FGP5_9ROSA|nr:serine/threonine-protein kinase 19 [Pyrus ussuriensis x Pyrus communis]